MTDTVQSHGFHLVDAPMGADRTEGWQYFRDAGDVFEADGTWFFTSIDAIQYAHHHPELFSSARAFDMLGSPVQMIPIASDRPDHVRYRRVLDPMLAPKVVNQMEAELRRQFNELMDAFIDTGRCDVIDDLALLYPTQVFLTLFGLPLSDRDMFLEWVDVILQEAAIDNTEPGEAQAAAAGALFAYLGRYVEAKRANPGEDMLSQVITLAGEDAWTDAEILGLCFLFVLAGLHTVTASIGFILYHLARNPELRRRVAEDPSLIGPCIEEVLRLELPAPMTPRVTTADVQVAGKTIPAGSLVQLVLGAADRDPSRFDCPNDIDIDHANRGHLAFGGGIHRCLGSHLARRELRIVVEEWHRRISDYELADGFEPTVDWPVGTLKFRSVPLTFTKR